MVRATTLLAAFLLSVPALAQEPAKAKAPAWADKVTVHIDVEYAKAGDVSLKLDVYQPKAESAKRTIEALNPDVTVKTYRERLTSENVDRILGEGWDVIVDGADNFPTRYLLNDASVWHDIPVVHGSIYRFEGQVTVFKPNGGPCYRCLFPQPPPPELAPSCAEGGVLGVLPGVVGSIQASEALKLALGIGDPLVGRLLLFDALAGSFTEVSLRRDPSCPVCGDSPTITEYIDYVEFCTGSPAGSATGTHA